MARCCTPDCCTCSKVSELGPLTAWALLRTLGCSHTGVSDLGPLAACASLQTLGVRGTWVTELHPLAACTQLTALDCSRTRVQSLGPMAACTLLPTQTAATPGLGTHPWLRARPAGLQLHRLQGRQHGTMGPKDCTLVRLQSRAVSCVHAARGCSSVTHVPLALRVCSDAHAARNICLGGAGEKGTPPPA